MSRSAVSFVIAVQQPVGCVGAVEVRVVLQSLRGRAGDRCADRLVALQLPRPGSGGERDALARAGSAHEHAHAAITGDRL